MGGRRVRRPVAAVQRIDRSAQVTDTLEEGEIVGGSATRRLRLLDRGLLVVGLGLFVALLHHLGTRVVLDNLRVAGWGIGAICLQELVAYVANTLGWRLVFPSPRPSMPFGRLLAVRMAGDSINYLTPTATLGGEFVRVRLLSDRVATTAAVASVAIARVGQTVGQIAFITIGLWLVIDEIALPPALHRGLLLLVGAMVAAAVVLVVLQRRGAFAPLLRVLRNAGLARVSPGVEGRLQGVDRMIAAFHTSGGWAFAGSCVCFFLGWAAGVIEVYLILFFLQVPVTVERALTIEVLSATLDGVLFFMPGTVGTQEGGKVLIFSLLGLDAAKGLSMGILRRIRQLVWAGIGLVILSRLQAGLRPINESAALRTRANP